MKDTSKKALRRGHNEGNIRQRTDGRWEVRLSAGIDYKTGKPRRTSTCCNTRQEAIAVLQQQAHEVRTQGWRDPMSVTLGEWYEYWLDTYMKDTVKQSTYASYRSYLNKHFCVLGKILLKKLEPHTLQEFYNYKFREEGLSPKTLRNYHMALHKCLQQAVKEHLLVYNPCDAVTLPSGEKPEISVFTNDQQRALVQASYRHRYGVFIRLDLCTGLRMGELLALKWEDIDFQHRPTSCPPYHQPPCQVRSPRRREQNRNRIRHPQNEKLPPHDSADPHNSRRAYPLETTASAG